MSRPASAGERATDVADAAAWSITVEGLDKQFPASGGHGVTHALAGVSLEVRPGEFVALIGRSGCGKTTLLRSMGGLAAPTRGSVLLNDQELYVTPTKPDRSLLGNLGFAFQDSTLLPWRTVIENIALPLELQGVDKAQRAARARDLASDVGLEDFLDHLPKQLSGGMRQRVSLARTLIANPSILLMDEPFGALDAMTRDNMNQLLHRLWHQHRHTVVLVTHSVQEAIFLADRVVVMTPGPGRVQDLVDVPFPHPRAFSLTESPEFQEHVSLLRRALEVRND